LFAAPLQLSGASSGCWQGGIASEVYLHSPGGVTQFATPPTQKRRALAPGLVQGPGLSTNLKLRVRRSRITQRCL